MSAAQKACVYNINKFSTSGSCRAETCHILSLFDPATSVSLIEAGAGGSSGSGRRTASKRKAHPSLLMFYSVKSDAALTFSTQAGLVKLDQA